MKNENMKRSLLFVSLATIAVGVGFLASCSSSGKTTNGKVKITSENDIVEVGSYPQTIVDETTMNDVISKGTTVNSTTYEYNGSKYTYVPYTIAGTEGGGKYTDGSSVQTGEAKMFKWEPIKWHVLYEDKDQNVTFLFATQTIETSVWQESVEEVSTYEAKITGTETAANDWAQSTIRVFLRDQFYPIAFDESEQNYVTKFTTEKGLSSTDKEVEDIVSILSETKFEEYKKSKSFKGGASDFAKAKDLHYHWHDYASCFFYLNTAYDGTKYLKGVRGGTELYGYANPNPEHNLYGVRPVIAIDNTKALIATKASENSGTAKANKPSAALPIGIIFSILGMAGLIAFLTLWNKGKIRGKFPLWGVVAIVACTLVITSVGVISLSTAASGGGAGGVSIKYGYYTQATAKSSGGGIVQACYTGWLIKSDGTCNYCGCLEDVEHASDFNDNESPGTWSFSNGKITLSFTNPMGSFKNTYTVKAGGKLYYGSTLAYQWVRGV